MTDAAVAGSAAKVSARWFYAGMAMTCFAIAVLGFMPTYFLPVATGKFAAPPIVHIHGLVLFAWVTFFCTQTWLVAKGKVLAHRTWGVVGISIMTAMVFIVMWVVSMRIAQTSQLQIPAQMSRDTRTFAWVSVSALLFIVPVFIVAIANIKRPETHKRLMLIATISMLGAPIARWFLTFLAPPPDPSAPVVLLLDGTPAPVAPPIEVAIPPALIGDVLWVIAMVYDWRTRGKVHPVYIIAGGIMLLVQLTVSPVANSDLWQSIAASLGHLAG